MIRKRSIPGIGQRTCALGIFSLSLICGLGVTHAKGPKDAKPAAKKKAAQTAETKSDKAQATKAKDDRGKSLRKQKPAKISLRSSKRLNLHNGFG